MKSGSVTFLALLACILWGSAFSVVKLGYDILNISSYQSSLQILFAGMRFTLAGGVILLVYFLRHKKFDLSKHEWKQIFILSLPQTFFFYTFFYQGMANTSGSNGSILSSLSTFCVVIAAHFLYKDEKISGTTLVGVLLGFLGIFVLNFQDGSFGNFNMIGEGYIMIATVFGASGILYTKKLSSNINPILLTGGQLFIAGCMMIALGYVTRGQDTFVMTAGGIAITVYLAMVSGVAFSIWATLLKHSKASKISIYKFTIPIFGVLISYIVLGERNDMQTVLVAMLLVTTGVFLINYSKIKKGA